MNLIIYYYYINYTTTLQPIRLRQDNDDTDSSNAVQIESSQQRRTLQDNYEENKFPLVDRKKEIAFVRFVTIDIMKEKWVFELLDDFLLKFVQKNTRINDTQAIAQMIQN